MLGLRGAGRLPLLLAVLVSRLLSPGAASAGCAERLFRDGFESGDTSRWSNSAEPANSTGAWVFSLDFDGSVRPFALELVQRPGGAVAGYLLGGTSDRTFVTGAVSGASLSFELELIHPTATRIITFVGSIGRDTISGTASGDISTQSVTLQRSGCELFEQGLLAAVDEGGPQPVHVRELSVVVDEDGAFVAGGFVGQDDCGLWACDGGVTSYSEVGDTLTVGLETDGGCSAGSSFTVTWAAGSGLYAGSYTFTDCAGTTSGSLLAAFGMGASSRAARQVLAARSAIAAGLEAGVPLAAPLAAVAPTFLHFGRDEPALRNELNDEMGRYSGLEVALERARNLRSAVHPRTLPSLVRSLGITIDERRSGVPAGGGPDPVTYRDTRSRPIIDDFALIAEEAGRWKIVGNQVPSLDLPFAYTVPAGGSMLEAPTADGNPVYVSVGPYGGHFLPLTGDPSGEAKANFVGFLAGDDSEMQELEGDFDGIREPGEVWGYPAGGDVGGDRVRLRRPVYVAPLAGEVRSVIYTAGPAGVYFDDEPHWNVLLGLPGDVRLAFGHLGRIAPALRDLVLAETAVDTNTFSGPAGTDLLDGFDPIPVAAGTELALPQILADPVPGHDGYYAGGGSFLEVPWAQIEFQVPFTLDEDAGLSADFCVYRFMSGARRSALQAVMDADMLDPDSERYRDRFFTTRWQWSSQGGLCQAESPLPRDFSDLYTSLGGWYERAEPGTTADEMFSFVPIDTTAAAYDPGNYDSAAVAHLVIRNLWPGPYSWSMPDSTTAAVFLAVGEVIERSSEALLIKWRDLNLTNPVVYQRAAYRLDSAGLTVEWGNRASTPGGAVLPVLLPGDSCDDSTVLCYDHSIGAWPP